MRTPLILLPSLALAASSQAQVGFDFEFGSEVSPRWRSTFQRAADIWSATLSGGSTGAPISLRYKVDTAALGTGSNGSPILGGANYTYNDADYAAFRGGLAANPNKSALDATALAHLEAGPNYTVRANDVKVKTDANGDLLFDDDYRGVPDLDANGDYQYVPGYAFSSPTIAMTTANMKAVGLTPTYYGDMDRNGTGQDGYDGIVTFADFSDLAPGGSFGWDFDPSDGVGAGGAPSFDALGSALHEIGHSLGFDSAVDIRDYYIGYDPDWYYNNTSALDLFRYELVDGQWVRSVQVGPRDERFSVDGQTIGQRFSTGGMEGNGFQASHWYETVFFPGDPIGTDLMRPRSGVNRSGSLTANDLAAFDAIGWNVQAVPEPAAFLPLVFGTLALLRRRRKA